MTIQFSNNMNNVNYDNNWVDAFKESQIDM